MRKQIFAVIARLSSKYPVSKMCAFYEVSTSGYYGWLKRPVNETDDEKLRDEITEIQSRHKGRLGYRRMTLQLKKDKDMVVNHKRILRVMSKYGLLSKIRRRKLHYYRPNGNLRYENVLNREFEAERPNEKWVSDISYIITPLGTLYLSTIRDLFDDFIVAYKMEVRQDYSLVKNTIEAAITAENPSDKVLLHTDGGGQYRSWEHHDLTKKMGITPSMSRTATPGDNSPAENFFSTYKCECIYLEKPQNPEIAWELTDEFMDYYRYERIGQDGKTPWERRCAWFETKKI